MKQLLLLLVLCIAITTYAQQQYHRLLDSVNLWQYVDNRMPVLKEIKYDDSRVGDCQYPHYPILSQHTDGDTLLDSNTYRKLYVINYNNATQPCLYGFLREDTVEQRVYFKPNNDTLDILLYDFSMQSGDSIAIDFLIEQQPGYYGSGIYFLDSIDTIQINAGAMRRYHLNLHTAGNYRTLVWIEGIGVLTDFVYTHTRNDYFGGGMFANECNFAPHDYWMFLGCFSHNEQVYVDSCAAGFAMTDNCYNYNNACDYYLICSGINEVEALSNITLMPNPTEDYLNVSLDVREHSSFSLNILDVNGQAVAQPVQLQNVSTGIHNSTFNVAHLPAGVYLLECRNENGAVYRKFIKQ